MNELNSLETFDDGTEADETGTQLQHNERGDILFPVRFVALRLVVLQFVVDVPSL